MTGQLREWTLTCIRCRKNWLVFRDWLKKQDGVCPFCGDGGVRLKDAP